MNKLVPAMLLAAVLPLAALAASQGEAKKNPADSFMANFDLNKDGKVSAEEFKKVQIDALERQVEMLKHQIDQQFQQMDKDHNGSLDKAEVDAFIKAMQERMQQMQQMHGGGQSDKGE